MRIPSRTMTMVAVTAFVACLLVYAVFIPRATAASPEDTGLAYRISRSFPERRTSSFEANRLLSHLSGQLQISGWSTQIQPYSTVTRVESQADKGIVFVRVRGENLLALSAPETKELDYLIISAYDNLFADRPEDPLSCSATAVSTSLAMEIAGKLNRDSREFGIAFVSGHYQYGAGLLALLDFLEASGIQIDNYIILGDIQALEGLPLVASTQAPVSLVEAVMSEADTKDLCPYISTAWMLDLVTSRGFRTAELSPDTIWRVEFSGEHDIVEALGASAMTVGLPASGATLRLSAAATPVEALDLKLEKTADAVAAALNTAPVAVGLNAGEMRVMRFVGSTRFAPDNIILVSGLAISLALAAVSLSQLAKDMSSLALIAGTSAAAALSMFLHHVFSGRASTEYASDIFPGRTIALFFLLFTLLLLMAFLRLWSIRSRIHHLHERSGSNVTRPQDKATWGSAWSLAILAALAAGASWTRSEILPSLLIAGVAHAIGTLILKPPSGGGRPPAFRLWLGRLMYLVPLLAVFWAGNPLSPGSLAVYRASWTDLNQGALVSALALSVVAASVLSTLEFPKPASPKLLVHVALCEIGVVVLFLASGFFLPASSGPGIPSWAISQEAYSSDTGLSFISPAPIRKVTFGGDSGPDLGTFFDNTGLRNIRIGDRAEIDWAKLNRTAPKPVEEDGPLPLNTARFDLGRQPDAVMVRVTELGALRTGLAGFEVQGLYSLLGAQSDGALTSDTIAAPPGYFVTFAWWNPVDLPNSLSYTVDPKGMTRIGNRLQAVYLDQSYLGIWPVTEGVRYYHMTSIIQD